jgi:hypothetical protein
LGQPLVAASKLHRRRLLAALQTGRGLTAHLATLHAAATARQSFHLMLTQQTHKLQQFLLLTWKAILESAARTEDALSDANSSADRTWRHMYRVEQCMELVVMIKRLAPFFSAHVEANCPS